MSDERYEIRGKIGQGGVGAVYRAFDRNLNREVAIKRVLSEEGFDPQNKEDGATRALLQEATALCSVQHPHIVTVYDAGVDDDGPYVVMELLAGHTLDEMIERGTMTWGDFRETAVQSLEALIAAQELDLVHRDIKPSNVMVTWLPSGRFQIKLVDFGLAKFSAAPSLQTIDHGDAVFGSIHFMAPEQFERVPLDKRTDMYSLGCVFFFCLTGKYPFDAETAPLVMAAHLQNTFTPLREYRPDLPDWLCQWVEWFLARNPDERPSDAREALERFLSFEQPAPVDAAPAHVQVVPAASLPKREEVAGGGAPSVMTGPIPLHVSPAAPVQSPSPPPAPSRLDLIPVGQQATAQSEPSAGSESASPPPSETETQATAPVSILPPLGSKPSVHTGAQLVRSLTGPIPYHSQSTPESASTPEPTVPQPPIPPQPPESSPEDASPNEAPTVAMPVSHTGMRSTAAKATLITFLVLGIVIATVVLLSIKGSNESKAEIQRLLDLAASPSTVSIPVNSQEVESLLSYASSVGFSDQKLAVYQALYLAEATDGTGIDDRVASYAVKEQMNEEVRSKLFEVVGRRGSESAVPILLDYAKESSETKSAVSAINAANGHLSLRHLDVLYSLISFTASDDIRAAAERAAAKFITEQEGTTVVTRDLLNAYQQANEAVVQQTYLRLLGRTGNERALEALQAALTSDDEGLKVAAYTAFGNWRDDSLFNEHLAAMAAETSSFSRSQAFSSLLTLLTSDNVRDGKGTPELWSRLGEELEKSSEKSEFIKSLARNATPWGLELIEPFKSDSDDDVSFLAEKAFDSVENRLKKSE